MSKKTFLMLAAMAEIAGYGYMHPYGMPLSRNHPVDERLSVRRKKKELSEKEKERIRQKYKSFQHEYVIYGEVIQASSRKCALKIWERRHTEHRLKKRR